MLVLRVHHDGQRYDLRPGERFTFGRDDRADLCIGADDRGISRHAGRIESLGTGWSVVNLSGKRPLHVMDDETRTAVPLPATVASVVSRCHVRVPRLTVFVTGERQTYRLRLVTDGVSGPDDRAAPAVDLGVRRSRLPRLSTAQREVVVALAAGYLRRHPDYAPRPRSIRAVGDQLGLSDWQVLERIRQAQRELAAVGMPSNGTSTHDVRLLCDWLVALGVVTTTDTEWLWLRTRVARAGPAGPGSDPQPRAAVTTTRTDSPVSTDPNRADVARIANSTAKQIESRLAGRLREVYGENWLEAVNRNLSPAHPQQHLGDERFCLKVLGRDPATRDWASPMCRQGAVHLRELANRAAHNRPVTAAEVDLALRLARRVHDGIPARRPSDADGEPTDS